MEFVPSRVNLRQEQFPLLKVEGGDGDVETTPTADPNDTAPVTRIVAPKVTSGFSTWWPELVSVCWVTLLVFIIGLAAFMVAGSINENNKRKNSSRFVECPVDVPQVYYYQIIQRDHKIQFKLYSEYLSMMATMYPHLCINVYFLEDDASRRITRGQRNNGLYNSLYKSEPPSWVSKLGIPDLTALNTMLLKNPNVNVKIMPLSCFMENTQMRDTWSTVPLANLAFYIKVHTVWKLSGIALDLATYRNRYIMHGYDIKTMEVFKKLNDDVGCKKRYDKESFSIMVNEKLGQLWFSNTTYVNADTGKARDPDDPLIRTQRNKRETPIVELDDVKVEDIDSNDNNTQNLHKTIETENVKDASPVGEINATIVTMPEVESKSPAIFLLNESDSANNIPNETVGVPKPKFFYDILTIYAGPPFSSFADDYFRLTMDPDGSFIAAACPEQPFLGKIIASDCTRVHPTVLIKSLYIDQCSGMFGNVWCGPVHFI